MQGKRGPLPLVVLWEYGGGWACVGAGVEDRLEREIVTFDLITDDAKAIPPVMLKPNTAGACNYKHSQRKAPTYSVE